MNSTAIIPIRDAGTIQYINLINDYLNQIL